MVCADFVVSDSLWLLDLLAREILPGMGLQDYGACPMAAGTASLSEELDHGAIAAAP